ncbi:MAG: nucleotidyltransferase family protein [bacterium]|nr:nucleotidyltransferase family protein [bacterium]
MKSANNVAIVILAAGMSARMENVNKLLLESGGKPMIRHVAEMALAGRTANVTVVTGHESELIEKALRGLQISFNNNPNFSQGMSTSLQAGLAGLDDNLAGAVILLGDMPDVPVEVVNALINRFEETGCRKICVPVSGGNRGNPVLLPRWLFSKLRSLKGDKGARQVIASHGDEVIEVQINSSAVHRDIDTPADIDAVWRAQAQET